MLLLPLFDLPLIDEYRLVYGVIEREGIDDDLERGSVHRP